MPTALDNGQRFPRELLRAFFARLLGRKRQVVVLRFGLDEERPKTLHEAAELLGVTRERVRQLENQALIRL